MGRIIEIPFSQDIIEFVAEKLLKEEKSDFSSVTVVFPHQRPAFYLRRILSSRIGRSFFPPQILSMDEFMSTLAEKTAPGLTRIDNLDSAYLLFQIVSKIPGSPWQKNSSSFSEFLFWGLKIEQVIGELDIELIKDAKLKEIGIVGDWGQDVSKNTQHLLGCLKEIRQAFHAMCEEQKLTTRSRDYARAARNIAENNTKQFPTIYFVGIFAMTGAEKAVIRSFLSHRQTYFLRQNDGSSWKPFEEMDGWAEKEIIAETFSSEIFLHSAFNIHSEIVGLGDILMKKEVNYKETAIVLPEPATLIPLLSGVMTSLNTDYNITMGYPISRTPLYTLLDLSMKLEETRYEDTHSSRDYLSLLMHPLVKNFGYVIEPTHMRILAHSVEESLLQGKTLIKLSEIEQNDEIFIRAAQMTEKEVPLQNFRDALRNIHEIFIRKMSGVKTLNHLGRVLEEILTLLLRHSPAAHYPFSGEFFHGFFLLSDKLRNFLLKDEEFRESGELFELFRHLTGTERISFQGIPLKGLQVLGLLEARCLNFKQVFLLDSNEGVLSSAASEDSLLPLSLRAALGLPLHYQREEIYRYHFHSLISSAREAHIFYCDTQKQPRSHFIEKLVWEREKNAGKIGFIKARAVALNALPRPFSPFEIFKTREILNILQGMNFSSAKLNSYLLCPASFYFASVLGLKEKDKTSSKLDATLIGTILHKVLEQLYRPLIMEKIVLGEAEYSHLEKSLPEVLGSVFSEAFGELRGEHYLLKEMALSRLKRYILLEKQRSAVGINIISVEEHLSCSLKLKNSVTVQLIGRADRIDHHGQERMIVDYKSGKNLERHSFKAFNFYNSRSEMKRKIKSIQLPLYVFLYHQVHLVPYEDINSKLISLRTGGEQIFFNQEVNRQKFMKGVFLPVLDSLIQEIFNPEIPFVRDDTDEKICEYCPFPTLCRKVRS
ncbi:MAG: ATP-dependent helicase/deoxyribonuclease subunit B [Syntrophomonadaceae bacterium]|nr:ATP-dependent helicase/deoxyribonuclease subunit B [Bacillota bacterium]